MMKGHEEIIKQALLGTLAFAPVRNVQLALPPTTQLLSFCPSAEEG